MSNPPKSMFLTVRLSPSDHHAFSVKARSYGGSSFVLREIVDAFLSNRLNIQPNPERPSLYDPGNRNTTPNPSTFTSSE